MAEVENTTTEQSTTSPEVEKVASEATAAPAVEAQAQETKTAEVTTEAAKETIASSDAKKASEAKEPVETKPEDKPVMPEKYELKLSKDSPLDTSHVAGVEAEAKAEGLSQDQAQARLARDEAMLNRVRQNQQEQIAQQQKSWISEVENDKEIGGPMMKENIEIAKRALNKFADDSFKKILNDSGLGNNPHLIRAFYRVGKVMADDKLVTDGKPGGSSKKASRESKLYPTHNPKQEN